MCFQPANQRFFFGNILEHISNGMVVPELSLKMIGICQRREEVNLHTRQNRAVQEHGIDGPGEKGKSQYN